MEKEGEREGVAKAKEKRKEDGMKRKTEAKVSFLKQYYPDAHSFPGGSLQIMKIRKHTNYKHKDDNSDRETGKTVQNNIP